MNGSIRHQGLLRTITLVLLLSSVVTSGCARLSAWGQTQTVSDPTNNLFHVNVPEDWQASTESGFISLYAGKTLPAKGESPASLSVLVFSSDEASSATTTKMLDYLVDARAESRGWTDIDKGPIVKAKVGGAPAVYRDVSAKEPHGEKFSSRFYFTRRGTADAFVAAIAPSGKQIDSTTKELEALLDHWYWHVGDDDQKASSTESKTAE